MKVWIDITNSPHVLFFAPIVRRLRAGGHEVMITARDYAQTRQLLEQHGMPATVAGRHRGRNVAAKALGLLDRGAHLVRLGRRAGFDVAAGHNSNDLAVAARLLGIPQLTMFDYEYARVSHHLNLRLVDQIVVPDAIPLERLMPYGIRPERVLRYPGLKEEYYLHDFQPDPQVLRALCIDPATIVVVLRPAPEVTLYHRRENPLVDELIGVLAARADVTLVLLPRTPVQRLRYAAAVSNVIVPERAVDGLSLVAAADMIIGAGGTMNREAVALGTPAYTLFAGRLGAVDERLIASGRLRRVLSVADVQVRKKPKPALAGEEGGASPALAPRDPQFFADCILDLAVRATGT